MKKRIFVLVLATLLLLSMTIPTLAANTTEGTTTLTYTVAPSYTVTIPASLTLGDSPIEQKFPIDVVNIDAGKVINVAITATSGASDTAFTVCYLYDQTGADAEKTVPYTVESKVGTDGTYSECSLNAKVGAATADTDVYFRFTRGTIAANLPAGTYGGTVTFTVYYENAVS